MPDYEDEWGDPLTPKQAEAAIARGQAVYEVVEEEVAEVSVEAPAAAPAQQVAETVTTPAEPARKAPKALLALAAVVVIAAGGGIAYGMHALGQQNTVEDVKSAVSSKASEVKQSVAPSSSAAPNEPEPVQPVLGAGCSPTKIQGAGWRDGEPKPEMQLAVEEAIEIPYGFRKRRDEAGQRALLALLRPSADTLGLYVASTTTTNSGKPLWWKVTVGTAGGFSVLGENYGTGRDKDKLGSCDTLDQPASYYVVGEGGDEELPTTVTLLKPVQGAGPIEAWALIGDKLARVALQHAPADDETGEEGASSSSEVPPSK